MFRRRLRTVRAFACKRTALRKVLYNFHMPNYRRSNYGSTYFFTVVTYNRRPILTSVAARNLLHTTWIDVQNRHPFTADAIWLLPDHIHCVDPTGRRRQLFYNIHYNPVKHGLVQSVWERPWSSFHRFIEKGYYSQEWGTGEDKLAQLSIGE